MLKVVIGLVLLAHGIGHSMGILQVAKIASVNPSWHGDSWILTGIGGSPVTQAVGVTLWTASIVGFTLLSAVVVGWLPQTWWAPLAVASALVSLAGLVLFPAAFPVFSSIGALLIDLIVLAAVLWYRWTPSALPA